MFDWSERTSLAALFASAFLSATVLPGNSEVVLFQVLRAHPDALAASLAVATLGNTLGSMTTYALGRLLPERSPRARAIEWLRRYGAPALILAWVPVIGDALCAAAGWLRIRWLPALAFTAAGKLARYLAVAQAARFFE
jgi:membrane protein YqaA with SNARE-associated domain